MIATLRRQARARGVPVLCVDTRKKERLGHLYRRGSCYSTDVQFVYDHDYRHLATGILVPHGVYDYHDKEVDELRSFVFRSKDKVWVWIAMNRETREIVASACGDRSENTCRILWDRVPSAYKETIVFSDYWGVYRAVIPSEQQRPVGKETGETAHIERWNNTLREQLARFLRETFSFSKCIKMHEMFLKLFIH